MAAVSYLDASAIVKLVIREAESDAMDTYMINREALISSRLSETEVIRAARRAHEPHTIEQTHAQAREALEALFLRAVDVDVLHRAAMVNPLELRTGDAIHLATALQIEDPELEFVTYDNRLAKAAELAGLRVVQPGRDRRARSWDARIAKESPLS
jgi:predicted nucleic acid-binding protein